MTSRSVAARARRSAAWTISVPELPNRTRSAHGTTDDDAFGEFHLGHRLAGEQLAEIGLCLDRRDDRGGRVTEDGRAHAEDVVDVVVAVDVGEVCA